MTWLCHASIQYPWRVVMSAVLITLAIAPGVLRLQLRTDGHALAPTNTTEIAYDASIRDAFGITDQIVVVITSADPDGIFNPHTLQLIQDLTTELAQIEGLSASALSSLATERSARLQPGTLSYQPFLEPFPTTRQDLDRVRSDVRQIQLYAGTLVSYDEKAAAILVGVPAGMNRPALYQHIQNRIDRIDRTGAYGPIREEVHVVGAPVAEALLGTYLLADLGIPSALLGHRIAGSDEAQPWQVPSSFYELRRLIGQRIGLLPLAIMLMAGVFFISFRRLLAVLLPLGEVAACLVVVFGLMGWFSVPVYLTIAVLPVILTAIGVADEIHIFVRYQQYLHERPDDDHVDVVATTLAEMRSPVIRTSLTTAIGFLSFVLSPIGAVQAFGVFASVGILFCMLWSLSVIPASLVLIPPQRLVSRGQPGAQSDRLSRIFHRLGWAVVRARFLVLLAAAAVLVIGPFGVYRIVVQDSWIDGFAPRSEFYQATAMVNQLFQGTHILLVHVDTGRTTFTGQLNTAAIDAYQVKFPADLVTDPNTLVGRWIYFSAPALPTAGRRAVWREQVDWLRRARIERASRQGESLIVETGRQDGALQPIVRLAGGEEITYTIKSQRLVSPEVLQRICGLEAFIEAHAEDAVGGVLGPCNYLATINFLARGGEAERRRIPDDPRLIQRMWQRYEWVRGTQRLRQVLDPDYAQALITVLMKNANYVATRHLLADIRAYEQTNLTPHRISLGFAGDVAVSQTLIEAIVTTQVRSLLLSLVGILAVTALLGRSWSWGLYCVLPCSLAVLSNFAVMGGLGIPLGVATSMFASMVLGIGVDYAIHFTERIRRAASRGLAATEAVVDAMTVTGPAIFIDAVAIALGFGIMLLSQVPANTRLGGLVMLSVGVCCVSTLLLLPAVLVTWRSPSPMAARYPYARTD